MTTLKQALKDVLEHLVRNSTGYATEQDRQDHIDTLNQLVDDKTKGKADDRST
jgi:hypothetical protein